MQYILHSKQYAKFYSEQIHGFHYNEKNFLCLCGVCAVMIMLISIDLI